MADDSEVKFMGVGQLAGGDGDPLEKRSRSSRRSRKQTSVTVEPGPNEVSFTSSEVSSGALGGSSKYPSAGTSAGNSTTADTAETGDLTSLGIGLEPPPKKKLSGSLSNSLDSSADFEEKRRSSKASRRSRVSSTASSPIAEDKKRRKSKKAKKAKKKSLVVLEEDDFDSDGSTSSRSSSIDSTRDDDIKRRLSRMNFEPQAPSPALRSPVSPLQQAATPPDASNNTVTPPTALVGADEPSTAAHSQDTEHREEKNNDTSQNGDQKSNASVVLPATKLPTFDSSASMQVNPAAKERAERFMMVVEDDGSGLIPVNDIVRILFNFGLPYEKIKAMFPERKAVSLIGAHPAEGEEDNDEVMMIPRSVLESRLLKAMKNDDFASFSFLDDIDIEEAKAVGAARTALDMRLRIIKRPHQLADGPFRRIFDLVVLSSIMFFCLSTTFYNFVELQVEPYWVQGINWAIHVLWFVDLLVLISVPTRGRDGRIKVQKSDIVRERRVELTLNIVTLLPVDMVLNIMLASQDYTEANSFRDPSTLAIVFLMIRSVKQIKFLRVYTLFEVMNLDVITPSTVDFFFLFRPLLRAFSTMVLILHLSTIVLFHENDRMVKDGRYLTALVFTTSMLTGAGPGVDVQGDDGATMAIVLSCACVLINGVVIGKLAMIIFRTDVSSQNLAVMRETLEIIEHYGVPENIQTEILSFQMHKLNDDVGRHVNHLSTLPPQMLCEVLVYVKADAIGRVKLFTQANTDCKAMLASRLQSAVAEPGTDIVTIGDVGDEMFMIAHGYANVLIVTGVVVATLSRGDYFGEIALLLESCERQATVRALTFCDLYTLDKDDFVEVLEEFPQLLQTVTDNMPAGKNIDVSHLMSVSVRKLSRLGSDPVSPAGAVEQRVVGGSDEWTPSESESDSMTKQPPLVGGDKSVRKTRRRRESSRGSRGSSDTGVVGVRFMQKGSTDRWDRIRSGLMGTSIRGNLGASINPMGSGGFSQSMNEDPRRNGVGMLSISEDPRSIMSNLMGSITELDFRMSSGSTRPPMSAEQTPSSTMSSSFRGGGSTPHASARKGSLGTSNTRLGRNSPPNANTQYFASPPPEAGSQDFVDRLANRISLHLMQNLSNAGVSPSVLSALSPSAHSPNTFGAPSLHTEIAAMCQEVAGAAVEGVPAIHLELLLEELRKIREDLVETAPLRDTGAGEQLQ